MEVVQALPQRVSKLDMGASTSVQALPQRVSKADAKAVSGALFDPEAFATHMEDDGCVSKGDVLRYAAQHEITHEHLLLVNVVT